MKPMKGVILLGVFLLSLVSVLAYTSVIDLGKVPSHSPATLSVELPEDFRSIEVAHYEASNPNQVAKYMGWNGMVKVNDQLVWNVKSSTPNGVFIMDRTIGTVVDATSGINSWVDATRFFKAGKNRVEFYHENQGSMGVKVRVTVVTLEEAKEQQKENWGIGFDVKKSTGGRCSSGSECASGNCKRSACCEAGKDCCNYDGECDSFVCDDRYYYCVDKQGVVQPSKSASSVENTACNGCIWQDGCFPVGKQLSNEGILQYCSTSGWMRVKKEGAACQQYHECASQSCARGVCAASASSSNPLSPEPEQSGWDRFVAWLKIIFG